MKKILLTTLLCLLGIEVFAKECEFGGEKLYSYSASIDRDVSYEFSVNGNVVDPKNPSKIFISSCKEAAAKKKSLLITLAPFEYSLEITGNSADYANEIRDDGCKIENNPFKDIQQFSERLENNRKKLKFIKSCVNTRITHSGAGPISIKNDPENCKTIKISDQEFIVQGTRCALVIYPDSIFEINYSISEKCRSLSNLKTLGLSPMETITRAMIYSLENNNSPDAERVLIGTSLIRFNIEPSSSQGKISIDLEDKGIPLYFSNYQVPDVFFGEVKIGQQKNQYALFMKILADNRCKKFCGEGVCTSSCDYTVPFVGLFSLYQGKKNGKKIFLNEWYDGSAIPANFQGIIPLQNKIIPELKDAKNGDEYILEVALSDPKYEYQMLKNKLKGLLPPLPGIPTVGFYTNLNNGFSGFSETGSLNTIPQFGNIREFNGGNTIGSLSSFEGLSQSTHWPAEYEMICNRDGEKCQSLSSKPFLTFLISFQIKKDGDQISMENLKIERKSNILTNYTKTGTDTPRVQCI